MIAASPSDATFAAGGVLQFASACGRRRENLRAQQVQRITNLEAGAARLMRELPKATMEVDQLDQHPKRERRRDHCRSSRKEPFDLRHPAARCARAIQPE